MSNNNNDSDVHDYDANLTKQERQYLSEHEHCLDYQLSQEQIQFVNDNGYLVVKGLIEDDLCDRIKEEMFQRAFEIFGFKEDDPETYHNLSSSGIIDIWNTPSLYQLRQHPKLYSVFCQLKTHQLVVSVDRVSIKPPCANEDDAAMANLANQQRQLHNDTNLWAWQASMQEFQAGVCLADCPEGGGGFFCIPKMHKKAAIHEYKKNVEKGLFGPNKAQSTTFPGQTFVNFEDREMQDTMKIEVPLQKGDVVIWSIFLPHNGGMNSLMNHWRLHAYVRFLALNGPHSNKFQRKWAKEYQGHVLEAYQTGLRPAHYATINKVHVKLPRDVEVKFHKPIELTPLGKKLIGLEPWEAPRCSPSLLKFRN